jgi:N-acetyl-alpha-D-glucosaminyl L-malate synthase BshA
MRIGILCFGTIGGSTTVATSLASHLVAAGHTVFLLAPAMPERLASHGGVFFRAVPYAGNPLQPGTAAQVQRLARAIAVVVREDDLDVVHAHYAYPHTVAAVAAREMLPTTARPMVITTLHGSDVTADPRVAAATSAALFASDQVSAVSASLASAAVEVFGIERPLVIPNCIDPVTLDPLTLNPLPLPDGDPHIQLHGERVLLHVSTLRPVKRAVDCIGILARVNQRVTCRLLVVGDGPDADAVRAEANRLGMADRVSMVGATTDVGHYLAQSDLLLLPSASEAFGMVALEAMAAGVPVVGTRVGGLINLVQEGVCGRLLPVGDLDGMAAAAGELLLTPNLAAAYGEAGRRIARERYAPAEVVAAYVGLYSSKGLTRHTLLEMQLPIHASLR